MRQYDHADPRLVAPCADWIKRGMYSYEARKWAMSPEWDAVHFEIAARREPSWNCDELHFLMFGGAI